MNTYIGIDLGTCGVKLLLVTADGMRGKSRAGRSLPGLRFPLPAEEPRTKKREEKMAECFGGGTGG